MHDAESTPIPRPGRRRGLEPAERAPETAVHARDGQIERLTDGVNFGGRALGIGASSVLEHALDMVGMTQEVGVMDAEAHRDDVAIAARAVEEEAQRIAPRGREDAHERVARRAGWGAARSSEGHAHAL